MKFFGGYSITELDDMNPKERDVFYYMLLQSIKEKNEARKQKHGF